MYAEICKVELSKDFMYPNNPIKYIKQDYNLIMLHLASGYNNAM